MTNAWVRNVKIFELLLAVGFIGSTFIPDSDQGEFVIGLEFAPQISVQENNMATRRLETFLLGKPEVIKVMSNVGSSSNSTSTSSRNNISQITVKILDKKDRAFPIDE